MEILSLAEYIIHRFSGKATISPMKLQKLLYYVYAWSLVANQKVVDAKFERWKYGPVNTLVYHQYKPYGSLPIPKDRESYFTLPDQELIDFIVENYVNFDAFTLSAMTHQEEPWKITPTAAVISDERIKTYYNSLRFARNFNPFDLENNRYYPLDLPQFTLDMSTRDAEEVTTYSSYLKYKKLREQIVKNFSRRN